MTTKMKAFQQYFPVVRTVYYVVYGDFKIPFETGDGILKNDHSKGCVEYGPN